MTPPGLGALRREILAKCLLGSRFDQALDVVFGDVLQIRERVPRLVPMFAARLTGRFKGTMSEDCLLARDADAHEIFGIGGIQAAPAPLGARLAQGVRMACGLVHGHFFRARCGVLLCARLESFR